MIHFIKEGAYLKIGLNISVGRIGWKPWITFIWCWYDVKNRKLLVKRLRVRTHMAPYFLRKSAEGDVISNFLEIHDLIACPRELLEDHAPKLIPLAQYFNQQYKAGVITRYYG